MLKETIIYLLFLAFSASLSAQDEYAKMVDANVKIKHIYWKDANSQNVSYYHRYDISPKGLEATYTTYSGMTEFILKKKEFYNKRGHQVRLDQLGQHENDDKSRFIFRPRRNGDLKWVAFYKNENLDYKIRYKRKKIDRSTMLIKEVEEGKVEMETWEKTNEKGLLVEKIQKTGDSQIKFTYDYDDQGRIIEENYHENNIRYLKTRKVYDDQGRLEETIETSFQENGAIESVSKSVNTYGANNLIARKLTHRDDVPKWIIEYEYEYW